MAFAPVFIACTLASCGGAETQSSAASNDPFALRNGPGQVSTPRAFQSDLEAALTEASNQLWLFVSGSTGDRGAPIRLKAFQGAGPGWEEAPLVARSVGTDSGVFASSFGGKPCVAYEKSQGLARLVCLRNGKWRIAIPPSLVEGAGYPVDLERTDDDRLRILLQQGRDFTIVELNPAMSPQKFELTLPPANVAFVQSEGGRGLAVAVQESNSSKRYLLERIDGSWVPKGPVFLEEGDGPFVSGAVELAETTLFPINDASSFPWTFSARVRRSGEPWRMAMPNPISRGSGNAQGAIMLAGHTGWAAWQENDLAPGGLFRSKVLVAPYDDDRDRFSPPVEIWSGLSIGPGDLQLASVKGSTSVLFMRSAGSKPALRAAVRRLSGL
jgi:hypothetical protein